MHKEREELKEAWQEQVLVLAVEKRPDTQVLA